MKRTSLRKSTLSAFVLMFALTGIAQASANCSGVTAWVAGGSYTAGNGNCAGAGSASATCNGVSQSNFQFASTFEGS